METKTLLGVVNVFSISEAWRSKAKHAIHLELDLFGVNSQILLVSLPHQFTQWVMGLGKSERFLVSNWGIYIYTTKNPNENPYPSAY